MMTPFGLLRMAVVPQGGTNSVGHVVKAFNALFEEFVPGILQPFIDDVPMKGAVAGHKETTEARPGVRAFIADHIADVERVLQWAEEIGLTFSGAKSQFGVREIPLLGFWCGPYGKQVEEGKARGLPSDWGVQNGEESAPFPWGHGCLPWFHPALRGNCRAAVSLTPQRGDLSVDG
ncbi:MAG: hypothetical protein BJ554DRAFT_4520 [Olpidium bornovanus]|uniref:Reverse transcriptase domain-containing protein n=1 Tax=Olpidium bornovanus TaxID=278681 RepID=A0A8H7ZMX7_9FUNG|nr:MAG: hypothetical protein BJ554DRAFT_4520 [Olpidium bornovanus]